MSTTVDASAAVFKIPHSLFDLPEPSHKVPTVTMRDLATTMPRRHKGEPPSSGFKEYMLFALRTRLTPELQELIGRSVLVSYTGYPAPSMRLSLPGGDREPHINQELKKELDALLSREANLSSQQRLECLLLRWNSVRYLVGPAQHSLIGPDGLYEKIPSRWVRGVLPFVPLDSSLQDDPDIPKIEYRDGGLYADCLDTAGTVAIDDRESYTVLYARLSNRVLALIRRWYDEGRVIDPEQSLVKRWKLESVRTVGGTTMFKPSNDWGLEKMSRGTLLEMPVSALLHELAKGRERAVAIRAGVNLVDYHEISKRLFGAGLGSKYHFSGGSLHFTPRDLDDLLRVLDGVNDILYGGDTGGAVVTLASSRLSWIHMYALIVQRSITSDIVVYVRRDIEPMFIFSFAVPLDTNLPEIRAEVVLRARRTMVYLLDHYATPGHLEPVDVHSILDNPDTQLPEDLSSPTVRAYLEKEHPEALQGDEPTLSPIQF